MKKAIPLLLLMLLALPILSAAAPPCLYKEITLALDDEVIPQKMLRIDPSHAMRAKKAGGYYPFYLSLCEKYSPKDALNYLAIGLGDCVSALCERHKTDPLNATLEWQKNLSTPFIYYEGHAGRQADLKTFGERIARAMDKESGASARAYTREVPAEITVKDLRAVTTELARFSTDFSSSGESRRHNIALAAQAISGSVLMPGKSFSFNDTVGERKEERGYRMANVVVNGEFVKGVGGGVCQVSTTLYNAVLLAALPVENAAAHSRPVSYVPCSRDCTVSSAIDFRFRNDTDHPLYVAAGITGSRLTFAIYGVKKEGDCALESEIVEIIPFRALYADGTLVPDPTAANLLTPGREGIRSRLYLIKEQNGASTRTLIRENLYPAKDALYRK